MDRSIVAFSLPHDWVWDFWIADDGQRYHLYFLHAPRTVPADDRHRHARIGHAISVDLINWEHRGTVLRPGADGEFDESATWTGCVVRRTADTWLMFYTGARFLSPEQTVNIETIGAATSTDLNRWVKLPGPVVVADPRWYEVLADQSWREEACRDPWVYFDDPTAARPWTMLYTARSPDQDRDDRGVIGVATSADLLSWTPQPPVSPTGAGFHHLEVPQVITIDGHHILLFSCPTHDLAHWRRRRGDVGGIWAAPPHRDGGWDTPNASLLLTQEHYSGRAVQRRDGQWVLLSFRNIHPLTEPGSVAEPEPAGVADPLPLTWSDGRLRIDTPLPTTPLPMTPKAGQP